MAIRMACYCRYRVKILPYTQCFISFLKHSNKLKPFNSSRRSLFYRSAMGFTRLWSSHTSLRNKLFNIISIVLFFDENITSSGRWIFVIFNFILGSRTKNKTLIVITFISIICCTNCFWTLIRYLPKINNILLLFLIFIWLR